jgi:hypothetical protein
MARLTAVTRRIAALFFEALAVHQPPRMTDREWLEFLFCLKDRDITRYQAVRKFILPGLLLAAPLVPVQGIGRRLIPAGATLWVRRDLTVPKEIQVEWSDTNQVFKLDQDQWGHIERHLAVCETEEVA